MTVAPTDTTDVARELDRLAQLATAMLNEHTKGDGLCAVCRCAWPCARVHLAEHNPAVL